MPPIVLDYKLGDGCNDSEKVFTYRRKPKVPVDVAMSFRGMAACRVMRGVWKEMSDFERATLSAIPGTNSRCQCQQPRDKAPSSPFAKEDQSGREEEEYSLRVGLII